MSNQEPNRVWHLYFTWISGVALGIEFLEDEGGRVSCGLHLGPCRVLLTREEYEDDDSYL